MSVFRNLIMNAFDAVKQCEGESTIQFIIMMILTTCVELMDTGCGIEPTTLQISSPWFLD